MNKFSDEMIIELLKSVDDPDYKPNTVEPTDEELNAMIPSMLKEVLMARKVVKVGKELVKGNINISDLETVLIAYEAIINWKFMNGENI